MIIFCQLSPDNQEKSAYNHTTTEVDSLLTLRKHGGGKEAPHMCKWHCLGDIMHLLHCPHRSYCIQINIMCILSMRKGPLLHSADCDIKTHLFSLPFSLCHSVPARSWFSPFTFFCNFLFVYFVLFLILFLNWSYIIPCFTTSLLCCSIIVFSVICCCICVWLSLFLF